MTAKPPPRERGGVRLLSGGSAAAETPDLCVSAVAHCVDALLGGLANLLDRPRDIGAGTACRALRAPPRTPGGVSLTRRGRLLCCRAALRFRLCHLVVLLLDFGLPIVSARCRRGQTRTAPMAAAWAGWIRTTDRLRAVTVRWGSDR